MREINPGAPKGKRFETPLTFDAKLDSTGLATKTIKYYRDRNLFTKAIEYGEEWLTINQDQRPSELLKMLASVYLNLARAGAEKPSNLEKAEKLLRESMKINPRDTLTSKLLARVLSEQNRIDEALALLQTVITQNPRDNEAFELLKKIGQLKQT